MSSGQKKLAALQLCSLRAEIFVFPESCDIVEYSEICRWWNPWIPSVLTLAPFLLVKDWAFQRCPFLTQSWRYHLLPCTCLPVECSKQVLLELSTIFAFFCCPCLNLFEKQCAGVKFRMSDYLPKTIKFISSNIKYLVFVLYVTGYRTKICMSLYLWESDVKMWGRIEFLNTYLCLILTLKHTRRCQWFVIEMKTLVVQMNTVNGDQDGVM